MNNKDHPVCYMITCKVTGLRYIGTTVKLSIRRFRSFCSSYKIGGCPKPKRDLHHSNMKIAQAMMEHGDNNFVLEDICHAIRPGDQWELEKILIAQWNTQHPHGYNTNRGGKGGNTQTTIDTLMAKPGHREFLSERMRKTNKIRWTPEARAVQSKKASARFTNLWKDPEFIERRRLARIEINEKRKR